MCLVPATTINIVTASLTIGGKTKCQEAQAARHNIERARVEELPPIAFHHNQPSNQNAQYLAKAAYHCVHHQVLATKHPNIQQHSVVVGDVGRPGNVQSKR